MNTSDNGDVDIIIGALMEPMVGRCGDSSVIIGGWLSDAWDSVSSVAKSVVHSKITAVVAGVTAVAFPAVGVPLAAGLAVSAKALDIADGLKGTPTQQVAVKKAIRNTVALAKAGHPDQVRAVQILATAARLRGAERKLTPPSLRDAPAHVRARARKAPMRGLLVLPDGRIQRGNFHRA